MRTITLSNGTDRKKKLIELPADVCRRLAVQAAVMGMSVKKLIETLVINALENSDDDAIYAYLLETRPEGGEMIPADEQRALLRALRKKALEDEV